VNWERKQKKDTTPMIELNKNIIEIIFSDFDFDPGEITELVQITPNKTALKGDKITDKGLKLLRSNYWSYRETFITNEQIGKQITDFVNRIVVPRKENFKEASRRCYSEFQVVQYYYAGSNPGCHISKDVLSQISETGFEIDIDFYCFENPTQLQ
jgi:hypothetical protein